MNSILTKNQKKIYGPRIYTEHGETYRIKAKVRYDDECGNGHNTFAITADIDWKDNRGIWREHGGGCCHEEIVKHFPELEPFIKWHLVSSDGPMHYVQNTIYHAGDRDCWGTRKGEPRQWDKKILFDGFPVTFKFSDRFIAWIERVFAPNVLNRDELLDIVEVQHRDNDKPGAYKYGPKYTFKGYDCEWHECPFDDKQEAEQFRDAFKMPFSVIEEPTAWGEGKEPELDAARHCAIWPDATLEQLRDKDALEARLPALLAEFKKDVESLGFVY